MISYKKLWIMLLEKNITKLDFRRLVKLSTTTMTKLNKNEPVSMEILVRICSTLECDIGDIVSYQPIKQNQEEL